MRKVVLYGFVLLCVTAVSFLSVTPVERKILNPDGTTTLSAPTKPTQVEVTNFPAVQAVSGTVNVGNLTTDGNGRLLVAVQSGASGALVLHSTTMTYQGDLGGRTGATQKCRAEFPGSHFPFGGEIIAALGTQSFSGPVRGIVWLSSETQSSWMDQSGGANCQNWTSALGGVTVEHVGLALGPKATEISGPAISCDSSLPILCAE